MLKIFRIQKQEASRPLTLLMSVLFAMFLVAMFPAHALGAPTTVGTQEELKAAIAAAPEGQETEISLSGTSPLARLWSFQKESRSSSPALTMRR